MNQPSAAPLSVLPSGLVGPDAPITDPGAGFGVFSTENPAGPSGVAASGSGRTVCWAGWMSEDADPASGAFPRDFRTWSPEGWAALRGGVAAWAGRQGARGDGRLCLRPAAGCVLSDPQACLTWLREGLREDHAGSVELLLDVVSMLTPAMVGELEDHAVRAFEALGDSSRVAGCVMGAPVIEGDRVRPGPLRADDRSAAVLLGARRSSGLADRPVLLVDAGDASLFA
ncbi:MAG: hypothetical protein ACTS22_01005 [Phycisphaerales bacterium]